MLRETMEQILADRNQNVDREVHLGKKEKTFFTSQTTKSGLNKKVTTVSTYFGDNEKVVYNLITTSNKLSLKAQESLKGVKDMKIYCK